MTRNELKAEAAAAEANHDALLAAYDAALKLYFALANAGTYGPRRTLAHDLMRDSERELVAAANLCDDLNWQLA